MTNLLILWTLLASLAAPTDESACRAAGALVRLRQLPEASGVAASRRTPGVFWANNDSADPVIVALDERGAIVGRIEVAGAAVDDWEDIAVGSCPKGSCVYIGDVGDNSGNRDHIRIYRTPEPSPQDARTQPVEAFEATYSDGAHDAEALFVASDGDVFIITKGDPGPVALYLFPLEHGRRARLERVGAPMIDGKKIDAKDRPTAADVSPDGRWLVVRTTHAAGSIGHRI